MTLIGLATSRQHSKEDGGKLKNEMEDIGKFFREILTVCTIIYFISKLAT